MTRPTIHLHPATGALETPCCDRNVSTLPIGDRFVTVERRHMVTCEGAK